MSLLIKALDHLDKNKQAEKSKTLTREYVADEALMLELMPVKTEKTSKLEQTVEEKRGLAEDVKIENSSADMLSLEEEAGITGEHITAPKITKSKLPVKTTGNVATKSADQTVAKQLPRTTTNSSIQADTFQNIPPVVQPSSTSINTATEQIKKSPVMQNATAELNQKAAAKVFVANKTVKTPSSKSALVLVGLAGALLVWLGLQGYSYIKKLTAPAELVVKPVLQQSSEQPKIEELAPAETVVATPTELPAETAMTNQDKSAVLNESERNVSVASNKNASASDSKTIDKSNNREDATEDAPKNQQSTKARGNDEMDSDNDASFSPEPRGKDKRKSLQFTSKEASSGVDPTLIAAYQSYTHGDDATAQRQYGQVLQHDARNVDALLGLAAIAQRQGRDADASGWYYKVLEIEPKNTVARSAMMSANNSQANPDVARTESRMKDMLAQQPDSANVHAALGNLYAAQGQWPTAQQAYFNASRLAPENADYAFNLAISLDQMGKTSLALQQYERALDLLNKSGGNSPDRAMLEARIHALR